MWLRFPNPEGCLCCPPVDTQCKNKKAFTLSVAAACTSIQTSHLSAVCAAGQHHQFVWISTPKAKLNAVFSLCQHTVMLINVCHYILSFWSQYKSIVQQRYMRSFDTAVIISLCQSHSAVEFSMLPSPLSSWHPRAIYSVCHSGSCVTPQTVLHTELLP